MKHIAVALFVLAIVSLACGGTPNTVISTPTAAPIEISETNIPDASPVPEDTPTTAPNIGKVGDTITQGDYIITVVSVETAQEFGDFVKVKEGNIFVATELIVESGAAAGVSVNPLYISVKDAEGFEYTSTILGKEPSLKSQNDLPAGEKMRGWVTFEVPTTATGLILTYQPLGGNVRIRFDLGL